MVEELRALRATLTQIVAAFAVNNRCNGIFKAL